MILKHGILVNNMCHTHKVATFQLGRVHNFHHGIFWSNYFMIQTPQSMGVYDNK